MPPRINLEPLRDAIESYALVDRLEAAEILERLEKEHGTKMGLRTLQRAMANWEIKVYTKRDPEQDAELRARIVTLFYQWRLTDQEMVELLQYDGFKLSLHTFSRMRRAMGLAKRIEPWQEEDLDVQIREVLRQEYDDGAIEDYGKGHLYQYIREKYHIIGRYALVELLAARVLKPPKNPGSRLVGYSLTPPQGPDLPYRSST